MDHKNEHKDLLGIHKKDIRFLKNDNNSFTQKYNNGMLDIENFSELKKIITEIYNEVYTDNQGDVADYIPQLKNVDENLFGVVLVTTDGQVIEIGDTKQTFCVQSCSKPINYGIALEQLGSKNVHNFVGKEPSGRNFNELCLNEEGLPHNPLINSGAIMTTSLLFKDLNISERFDKVFTYWKDLTCNTYLSFNNSVYLSEKDSADRNYCLGYMMQENGSFMGLDKNITNSINRDWSIHGGRYKIDGTKIGGNGHCPSIYLDLSRYNHIVFVGQYIQIWKFFTNKQKMNISKSLLFGLK